MKKVYSPTITISTFLWIGFVGAISFMESWLKFLAPGITIPLALGIGRLVFGALNKVEWVFAIIIGVRLYQNKKIIFQRTNICYIIPFILLILQTLWLLPALDARAELQIKGLNAPASYAHYIYAGMEGVKIICLFVFGISQFENINPTNKLTI
ncbi:MAG TPA: hypothetical protein PKM51_08570 [Chitinophagales bacterium]|nr:hypothetical protein [Chitinophagales bacterium]HNM32793.1 hypothetical protein [Chitinophagales bacterium]